MENNNDPQAVALSWRAQQMCQIFLQGDPAEQRADILTYLIGSERALTEEGIIRLLLELLADIQPRHAQGMLSVKRFADLYTVLS